MPRYLLGPLTSVADLPSRRALRSAVRLVVPSVRLSTVGSPAFPAAAPRIWNSVPEHVVTAATLSLHSPVLQETPENVLTATIVLTSTLVVLEVTSVT